MPTSADTAWPDFVRDIELADPRTALALTLERLELLDAQGDRTRREFAQALVGRVAALTPADVPWSTDLDRLAKNGAWDIEWAFNQGLVGSRRVGQLGDWVAAQTEPRALHALLRYHAPIVFLAIARQARVWDPTIVSALLRSGTATVATLRGNPHFTAASAAATFWPIARSALAATAPGAAPDAAVPDDAVPSDAAGAAPPVAQAIAAIEDFAKGGHGLPEATRNSLLVWATSAGMPHRAAVRQAALAHRELSAEDVLRLAQTTAEDESKDAWLLSYHPATTVPAVEALLARRPSSRAMVLTYLREHTTFRRSPAGRAWLLAQGAPGVDLLAKLAMDHDLPDYDEHLRALAERSPLSAVAIVERYDSPPCHDGRPDALLPALRSSDLDLRRRAQRALHRLRATPRARVSVSHAG